MRRTVPLLGLLCILGWQTRAMAHGAVVEYQKTQAYQITAAYDTGDPMVNAQVAVFSPDDPAKPWLTGTTDAEGRFLFNPPAPGRWEVQVRQAGHGEIVVISVEGEAASPQATGEPVSSATGDSAPTSALTSVPTSAPATDESVERSAVAAGAIDRYSPLQKGLMAGSVIWGCVGTALFFARGRKRLESDAHS